MQRGSPIRNNPNATAGAGGGFVAVLVTWLAGNVFHWQISAETGAIIATGISTVVLLIGREGIKGIARMVWSGSRGAEHADGASPSSS